MNIKSLIIRCLTNYLIAIMEIQKLEFVSKSWEIDTAQLFKILFLTCVLPN